MPLEHLTISPEVGAPIAALFNPERYTVSKSFQLAEIGIPGLDSPVVQYVRGQNEKISMELFFDTTDGGMIGEVTDVRDSTTAVYQLHEDQFGASRSAPGKAGLGYQRAADESGSEHRTLARPREHQRRVQSVQSGWYSSSRQAECDVSRSLDDRSTAVSSLRFIPRDRTNCILSRAAIR